MLRQVCGLAGGKYVLPCVAADWSPAVLLPELAGLVIGERLENLEQEHFDILRCVAWCCVVLLLLLACVLLVWGSGVSALCSSLCSLAESAPAAAFVALTGPRTVLVTQGLRSACHGSVICRVVVVRDDHPGPCWRPGQGT